jgi:hypothetical protein
MSFHTYAPFSGWSTNGEVDQPNDAKIGPRRNGCQRMATPARRASASMRRALR